MATREIGEGTDPVSSGIRMLCRLIEMRRAHWARRRMGGVHAG